jgi:hypothetical protein
MAKKKTPKNPVLKEEKALQEEMLKTIDETVEISIKTKDKDDIIFKEMKDFVNKSSEGLDEKQKVENEKMIDSFRNSYSIGLADELVRKSDSALIDLYFEMYKDPMKKDKASKRAELSEKYNTEFVDLAICGEIMRRFAEDVMAREAYYALQQAKNATPTTPIIVPPPKKDTILN